jgi:hypothetical protein
VPPGSVPSPVPTPASSSLLVVISPTTGGHQWVKFKLAGACPALAPTLGRVLGFWDLVLSAHPLLQVPVLSALQGPPDLFVTFVLDPSTDPAVIALRQRHGSGVLDPLFRLSRAWVWAAHRERLLRLGLHQYLL